MYKLFNRVSSGSKEREPPSPAPSTFEEKFKLFNRGSSASRAVNEREPSFQAAVPASPVEETKFRLFGRSSSASRTAQDREPSFHAGTPPPQAEERFRLFGRGSAASRLANHDREPPPATQVTDEKPKALPAKNTLPAEEPEQPQILLPCPTCFRTFRVESLDRHKGVCEKVATKKRKVFDSAKQRLEDLPEVVVVPVRTPLSPTLKRPSSSPVKKQPAWKENHLSLIRTVREARASDMSRCPFCERNFNNKAYDRHVEWCKEQLSRIPKSPTHDTNEAKERWEARTKYRAPSLRRSIRCKYSPTRSLLGGSAGSPAASVDRLPECSKSLSGSRASLDSRASSSAMSYQPQSSASYAKSHAHLGASHTLGRAAGGAFVRQSHERRSLRAAPASPPPARRSVEPPAPVPLTPINNNRTSALRASLRMKSAFSNLNNAFQAVPHSQPKAPVVSRYAQQLLTTPAASQHQKRPTVLQLFSSAFHRQGGSSSTPAQPVSKPRALPSLTNQGRRSEPEGVESKLMTASCYGNYPSPTSPSATISKLKPPSRSTHVLAKFRLRTLVPGTSILPNKVCPTPADHPRNRRPTTTNHRLNNKSYRHSSSESYNPYLSAEKQLAELFDDDYSMKAKSPALEREAVPSPLAPKTPTPAGDENTNMEQLERDLKSILSEINQLGRDKEPGAETARTVAKTTGTPPRLQTNQPTKVSTLSITMSVPRTPSTPRTPSSPVSPVSPPATKAATPEREDKHLPRFCHSCGSAYPERFQVKFCCQCGARRLYI